MTIAVCGNCDLHTRRVSSLNAECRHVKDVLKMLLLFEYRTAECKLDWIDLLALMVFHLSLDEDCNIAELL